MHLEYIMNWMTFRAKLFDLACFNIHQVYAWQPGFDRNNIVRWTRKGYIIRLRQGVYAFPEYKGVPDAAAYCAGRMYSPSYISLHTALSFYGLIPEAVVQVTSVTSLKTAAFTNAFGDFSYRSVKPELMFGHEPRKVMDGRALAFATREKAILDLLYLYPFYDTVEELEQLRLDPEALKEDIRLDRLEEFLEKFRSRALAQRVGLLRKVYRL
jgi:predicted transcriptional regulator of viral defense system